MAHLLDIQCSARHGRRARVVLCDAEPGSFCVTQQVYQVPGLIWAWSSVCPCFPWCWLRFSCPHTLSLLCNGPSCIPPSAPQYFNPCFPVTHLQFKASTRCICVGSRRHSTQSNHASASACFRAVPHHYDTSNHQPHKTLAGVHATLSFDWPLHTLSARTFNMQHSNQK